MNTTRLRAFCFRFAIICRFVTPSPHLYNVTLPLLQPHSVTIILVFLALLFHSAFGSMERTSGANALLGIKASSICFLW